ncbi:hypothetical protein V0R50_18280 [Pseudomonas sp. 148P]|uniref:Uncharacterized protein n=1 Tax=Pseudomonas ulcerans TaxID=3115852 RepID=A0ABU7HUF6_9PSED|nr:MULTISPECIES: hypothetical protein [unclassified Pseudomonas]MEE1924056.1 hypothetical protein [Pseudomonas sp. 147P]MEE1935181.1 hypothetical protein [Pseudomonas sp. 148P]
MAGQLFIHQHRINSFSTKATPGPSQTKRNPLIQKALQNWNSSCSSQDINAAKESAP